MTMVLIGFALLAAGVILYLYMLYVSYTSAGGTDFAMPVHKATLFSPILLAVGLYLVLGYFEVVLSIWIYVAIWFGSAVFAWATIELADHFLEPLQGRDAHANARRLRPDDDLFAGGRIAAHALFGSGALYRADLEQPGKRKLAHATLFDVTLDEGFQFVKHRADLCAGEIGVLRDLVQNAGLRQLFGYCLSSRGLLARSLCSLALGGSLFTCHSQFLNGLYGVLSMECEGSGGPMIEKSLAWLTSTLGELGIPIE